MLVDDDAAIGAMYALGLEAAGFRAVVLSDVSSLFLALEADLPDVLVLDFQLGGIVTGVDILENLRLDDRTADVPVLLLSNHVGDMDGAIDRAHAAGACGWHVKAAPPRLSSRFNSPRQSGRRAKVTMSNLPTEELLLEVAGTRGIHT